MSSFCCGVGKEVPAALCPRMSITNTHILIDCIVKCNEAMVRRWYLDDDLGFQRYFLE